MIAGDSCPYIILKGPSAVSPLRDEAKPSWVKLLGCVQASDGFRPWVVEFLGLRDIDSRS